MNKFEELLDPELIPGLQMLPPGMTTLIGDDPPAARAMFDQLLAQLSAILPPTDVTVEERHIPGPDGDVPVYIYQPPGDAPRPGLLWIHGGGYIIGSGKDDLMCPMLAEHAGCTIVSVDYRMAPEHPFPAGPEDCHAALLWMVDHAAELGIDTERMAIGGASAGSGMAAGVVHMNRDRGGPKLKLQLLIYPMIDDTHNTPSGHLIRDERVWNRSVSHKAWKMYLGDSYGKNVSPYAAASRATDFSGLPPAFITVGSADLFRDENIAYAQKLLEANVPVELHLYHGMYHGGESFGQSEVGTRMRQDYLDALKRALA